MTDGEAQYGQTVVRRFESSSKVDPHAWHEISTWPANSLDAASVIAVPAGVNVRQDIS
jgi:hypothetical protein